MEATSLSAPVAGLPSFERPGRCEIVAARGREARACVERRSPCGADNSLSAALRYRRSERAALYIETREGDVVRLNIRARSALHAAVGAAHGETRFEEVSVSSGTTAKIRFSADGDLNAEELAAIRSVVEQATGLAAEFFAGDARDAFAAAASLDIDGAQLARVGMRLSMREHVTYSAAGHHRSAAAPVAELPPPKLEAPAASSEVPAAAAADGAAAPVAAAPADAAEAAAAPATAAAVDASHEKVPVPDAPPGFAGALATIAEFLAYLRDSLAEPLPAGERDGASIALSLKLKIFHSVALTLAATQAPASDDPASGVPLLGETLDALAAHAEPLDATA